MRYQAGPDKEGERDCGERWEILSREFVPGALLDVGSAEGYFPCRAASELGMMAVSIEANEDRVAEQVAAAQDLRGRMAVCSRGVGPDFMARLSDTCEFFENTLLLSVLHWFDEPEEMLASVCSMSGKVFVELPEPDDPYACGANARARIGGDLREWLERYSGRSVRLLGEVSAHTSKTRRLWVIEGPLERLPRRAYLGAPVYRDRFRQVWDGQCLHFFINGCEASWEPGVNAHTLNHMSIEFPTRSWWDTEAREALARFEQEHGMHEDTRIWNLIATADGLRWIDGKCLLPQDSLSDDLRSFGKEP